MPLQLRYEWSDITPPVAAVPICISPTVQAKNYTSNTKKCNDPFRGIPDICTIKQSVPMKLKENIAVSESGFLFDPNTGESFSVNSTGKEILKLLSEGKELEEIESLVMETYEVDHVTFNRYMDDFMHSLRRFNMVESEEDDEG